MEKLAEAEIRQLQNQTLTKEVLLTKYLEECNQEKILQGIYDMKYVYPGHAAQLICEIKQNNINYDELFITIKEHVKTYMPKGYGLHYSNIPNRRNQPTTFIGTGDELRQHSLNMQDDRYFVVEILAIL